MLTIVLREATILNEFILLFMFRISNLAFNVKVPLSIIRKRSRPKISPGHISEKLKSLAVKLFEQIVSAQHS
jgi:hypothetical protein